MFFCYFVFVCVERTLDRQIYSRMMQYYKDNDKLRKGLVVRSQLMAVVGDYSLSGYRLLGSLSRTHSRKVKKIISIVKVRKDVGRRNN